MITYKGNREYVMPEKSDMKITLSWPDNAEAEDVLDWLWNVEKINGRHAWTMNGVVSFSFAREEDAIAFRLKFGG